MGVPSHSNVSNTSTSYFHIFAITSFCGVSPIYYLRMDSFVLWIALILVNFIEFQETGQLVILVAVGVTPTKASNVFGQTFPNR